MSYTVLLIDDSDAERTIYKHFLDTDKRQSYQLIEVETGEAALDWCQQHVADVILLDYRLAAMDGLEVLRELRRQQPDAILPVILMTGFGNTTVAVEALKLGAQEYIDKAQITEENLPQLVRSVGQQVQLKRQLARQQAQSQVINELALRMRQSLDPQQLMDTATQDIRQFLQVDRVLIYQFAPDWSGEIVSESVGAGYPIALGQQIQDTCFQQGAGVPYRQGKPWAMADIEQANLTDCHRALLERFAVKANLVVPILEYVPDRIGPAFVPTLWGLLVAHHCAAPHAWQEEEIVFLEQISVHLAGAMQQATLYQQAQMELAERKQAEIALSASESRLRLAQAASKSGVWDWDLVTKTLIWSPEYYALYKLDPSIEASYEAWLSSIHPDDRQPVNQQVTQALETGLSQIEVEFRVPYAEDIQWFVSIGHIFHNEAGEPNRVIGITIDITLRKQAEIALQESEARFRCAILEAPIPIMLHTDDGKVLLVNQTWTNITGYTQADIPTIAAWAEKAYGNRKDEIHALIQEHFSRPTRTYVGEFALVTQSGDRRIWDFYGASLGCRPDGRQLRVSAAVDCTEQRLAQTQLQSILDSSEVVVYVKDREGRYLLINQWYETLTQFTRQEVLGKTDFDLYPAETAQIFQQHDHYVLTTGIPLRFEETVTTAAGTHTYLALKFPLRDASGQIYAVCSMSSDITELKQTQEAFHQSNEQLQAINQELERANQAKEGFLRMMNHELRTPLNVILGMAEVLQEEILGTLNDSQRQAVAMITSNGQHLLTLVNNILQLVNLEAGKIKLNRSTVLVQKLCENSVAVIQSMCDAKSIRLQTQIAPGVSVIQVDGDQIQQILTLLLENASKFTPDGGTVTLEVKVCAVCSPPNPAATLFIQFSVQDTGIGIAPDQLQHLFQFFTQLDDRLSRSYEGIGVGLALVRRLVELHRGYITVASQVGQGSCFTVNIPV